MMCGCHSFDARSASRLKRAAVLRVGGYVRPEHLQGVTARQPRMLGKINFAHTSRTEQAHDPVAGNSFPCSMA